MRLFLFLHVSSALLGLALPAMVFALEPISDSFDGKLINAQRWTAAYQGGSASWRQSECLEYGSGTTGESEAYLLSTYGPSNSEPWEVIVDARNNASPTSLNQVCSTGIEIFPIPTKGGVPEHSLFLELYASRLDQDRLRRGFCAELTSGEDTVVQKDTLDLGCRVGSLRLRFNPQVQSFEIFHDATGSADGYHWTRLAEPGLGPTSLDDGGNDWGLPSEEAR